MATKAVICSCACFVILQIKGAGFAMVGEQMPITLSVTAADPILQAELAVKAEYLEGGGHSELQMLLRNADDSTHALQVSNSSSQALKDYDLCNGMQLLLQKTSVEQADHALRNKVFSKRQLMMPSQ